jgi:hypothetical protein
MKNVVAMLILELACLSFAHASPITTVFDNLGGANTYDGAIVYAPYYYAVYASFTTLDPEFVLAPLPVCWTSHSIRIRRTPRALC